MTAITSAGALAEAFEEFGWFEDGQSTSISPPPGGARMPEQVELVMRDSGTGGLEPGDMRTYCMLKLTATGVQEWSFEGQEFNHVPDHAMEGAEPAETPAGFGFTVDIPTVVRLVATAFEFERLPDVTEAVAPWTSDRELHVTAPGANLPAPAQWVEALVREDVEVAWRIYGDAMTPTEDVPKEEYVGWFVARPSRLSEDDGGLFFRWVKEDVEEVSLALERWGADDELWAAACRAAAHLFPEGEFASGNCRFSADEWLAHLAARSDY